MPDEPLFQPGQKGMPGELYPVGPVAEEPEAPAEVDEFGREPASPEEQAVYEQFVVKAEEFITQSAPQLIEQLNNDQVPVYQSVGRVALQIAEMVSGLAKAGGTEVDEDIMLNGGEEIVERLMELGDAAKIWPFDIDSEKYDEALGMALMHGAELKANEIIKKGDPEVRASYEDKLAFNIARETEQGQGPGPEFFDNLQHAKTEIPRRMIHGVK